MTAPQRKRNTPTSPTNKKAQPNITDFATKKINAQHSPKRNSVVITQPQEADTEMPDINAISQFPPLPSAAGSPAGHHIPSPQAEAENEAADVPNTNNLEDLLPPPDPSTEYSQGSEAIYVSNDIVDDVLGYDERLESIEAYADRVTRDKTGSVIMLSKEAKKLADQAKAENAKQREQLHQEHSAQAAERCVFNKSSSHNMDVTVVDITCEESSKMASESSRSSVNPYKKKSSSTNSSPAQSILRNSLASVCGSQGLPASSTQNKKPGLDKPIILKKRPDS
jgi:hypothetical protein